jgi:hypothetical protein
MKVIAYLYRQNGNYYVFKCGCGYEKYFRNILLKDRLLNTILNSNPDMPHGLVDEKDLSPLSVN